MFESCDDDVAGGSAQELLPDTPTRVASTEVIDGIAFARLSG
jgi:hypothetical protein